MLLFKMWQRAVHYEDGWFIYADGQGHCSVISEQRARDMEEDYLRYQAGQAINRGGMPQEQAYCMYGFRAVGDEGGRVRFELKHYAADSVVGRMPLVEMSGTLVIPKRIGYFEIDMVCDKAFSGCTDLERVVLPETVTAIGERAFFGCSHLVDVALPKGLASIGEHAFEDTPLDSRNMGS